MKSRLSRNFKDVWKSIKESKKGFAVLTLLNLAAILVIVLVSQAANLFFSSYLPLFLEMGMFYRVLIGLAAFVSFLVIQPLIYSFFKLIILFRVRSFFAKTKISLGLFWRFYIANFVLFACINLILVIWMCLVSVLVGSAAYPFWTFILPVFFIYSFVNIYHSFIIQNLKVRYVQKALKITFNSIASYLSCFILDAGIVLAYIFAWQAAGWILMKAGFWTSTRIIISNYIFFISLYLVVLLLLCFNQLFFYNFVLGDSPK